MKKHSKLMIKALSLTAGFALVGGSMVFAADVTEGASAVVQEQPLIQAASEEHHVEEVATKKKRKNSRRKHRNNDRRMMATALLNTRIDEHATARRKDKNSLYGQYEAAKAADVKSIAPKTLTEIGMMVDDSSRRLELFKYIEANKTGTMVLDADKVAFKAMLDAEIASMRKEAREVRELVEQMALENNFSLMSEEDVLELYRKEFKGGHKHRSAAPQRKGKGARATGHVSKKAKKAARKNSRKKHRNRLIDKDGDGKDDRDTNNDGRLSKAEKKAARAKNRKNRKRNKKQQVEAVTEEHAKQQGEHQDASVAAPVVAEPAKA